MNRTEKPLAFQPGAFDVFIGMDTSKKSIAMTFTDDAGEIKNIKMAYNPQAVVSFVQRHYTGKRVAFAYEAGPTGYGLYDELTKNGFHCMVVSPGLVPKKPGNHVKTDRIDGETLSMNLRGGQIQGIQIPMGDYRNLRHLIQLRDTYVKQLAGNKTRVKSLLLFHGISFPGSQTTEQWSCSVMTALRELSCDEHIKFHIDQLLDLITFQRTKVLEVTRHIRKLCKGNEEIQRNIQLIGTISGIGFITASQVVACVGDTKILRHCDQLAGYFGLAPKEHSSGETTRRGSITRAGNPRMRTKLIQCAWAAIRTDQELKAVYTKILTRNHGAGGPNKAIVAVARRLATRIYAVLTQQRPYILRNI